MFGINRIDGERPDRGKSPWAEIALPPSAAIVADEHSGIATRENGLRLRRVGDQRLYAAVRGETGRDAASMTFRHLGCAIRPSRPFQDICCNPLPYAASL